MKPHFGYLMVCTKMWHIHFLSRRTLGLAPFPAAPCPSQIHAHPISKILGWIVSSCYFTASVQINDIGQYLEVMSPPPYAFRSLCTVRLSFFKESQICISGDCVVDEREEEPECREDSECEEGQICSRNECKNRKNRKNRCSIESCRKVILLTFSK